MTQRIVVDRDLAERLIVDSFVAAATPGGALVSSEERRALQALVREAKRLEVAMADRPP